MMLTAAIFSIVVLVFACTGYGVLVSRLCRAHRYIADPLEQKVLGFAVGVGMLGWLAFFPGVTGYFNTLVFWFLCLLGVSCAAVMWGRCGISLDKPNFSWPELLLLALIVCAAAIDIVEGISPPGDADSLAYHYALPADFLAAERISFVPRAVSGAIPLLLHMTYAIALGTGGELSLTLWGTVTAWATVLLFYAMLRRHVSRVWALSAALILLTTPAVLYGGGNGQVEIRCALFALAAVAFVVASEQNAAPELMLLGGLCAGFFMGAKFYGLIFVGAAGLVILLQRGGLRNGFVFGLAALLAGFQWYFWNWLHTGDPIFPTLTNLLQFSDTSFWTRDFGRYFEETMALGELPLERSVLNWFVYPVLSVFNLVEALEGGRTGLGIFSFLILPLAVIGLVCPELRRREFIIPFAISFVFFSVWFFSGTAQRSRHLLSIYPLVLIALFPLADAVARRAFLSTPLAVGIGVTTAIQIAGQSVFGLNYVTYVFSSETREHFYERNVPGANAASWLNREFPKDGKLGFMNRQISYLLTMPRYMMHPHIQVLVDTRPTADEGHAFVAQVQKQGLSHLLLPGDWGRPELKSGDQTPFFVMIGGLAGQGCLVTLKTFQTVHISSRSLRGFGSKDLKTADTLFEIVPKRCP